MWTIKNFQIDNQLKNTQFPILLWVDKKISNELKKELKKIENEKNEKNENFNSNFGSNSMEIFKNENLNSE